jgi:hypothetical protein
MTKGRRERQPRKQHPLMGQTSSVDGSDLASLSTDALHQRIDAIIRATRDRRLKLARQGKFEFLRRGIGPSSVESEVFKTTTKRIAQTKRSNVRSREARVLQSLESLDICNRVEQVVSDFIRRASTGDRIMLSRLVGIAANIICSLNAIAIDTPDVVRPISRKSIFWPALIGRKRSESPDLLRQS